MANKKEYRYEFPVYVYDSSSGRMKIPLTA
jgi:hypothetical protein